MFSYLCSIYAPHVAKALCSKLSFSYPTQITFYFLSIVMHTINESSMYVYEHIESIIVTFATLVNTHFDKI